MTKKLILLALILILVSATIPAQAGKPTPPPYPPPGAGVGVDAYPPPAEPLPGVELPDEDPRPYVPYAWGYFGKWYVSVYPTGILTQEYGTICINALGTGIDRCYEIGFEAYYPDTQTLLYSANPTQSMCGRWWKILSVFWLGQWADIRTPNEYLITCSHLPFGVRSMIDWFLVPGL